MGLHIADRWIWDFWLVERGREHHMFYLQAPRSVRNPDERHWHTSIGHAVSDDLTNWEVLPDALKAGPRGAWDDYSIWTGSIVAHEDRWYLLYTGTSHAERGLVQRIGLATSDDLVTWERHGTDPVLEADSRWYELLDLEAWREQAWRDPWVFPDPEGHGYHALITARANRGRPEGRGVVAHARSMDMVQWEVQPPLTEPDGFGHLEVTQLFERNGFWYLLFCSEVESQTPARRRTVPGTGTYYLKGAGPFGPFESSEVRVLEADPAGSTYGGRLVGRSGEVLYLAWLRRPARGEFVGAIGEPRSVRIGPEGSLRLDGPV